MQGNTQKNEQMNETKTKDSPSLLKNKANNNNQTKNRHWKYIFYKQTNKQTNKTKQNK